MLDAAVAERSGVIRAEDGDPDDADPGTGRPILVVEDDPLIASFVVKCLTALRFTVEWVTTGTEALDRIEQGGVDVQILDLGLPDLDGLEVLRILRDRGSQIPTIVITARGDPVHRTTALRLGAADYLRKPFPLRDLIAAVRRASGLRPPG